MTRPLSRCEHHIDVSECRMTDQGKLLQPSAPVDCMDNIDSRYLIKRACNAEKKLFASDIVGKIMSGWMRMFNFKRFKTQKIRPPKNKDCSVLNTDHEVVETYSSPCSLEMKE